jgi:glycerophosphoryl diester phosphodiesterase
LTNTIRALTVLLIALTAWQCDAQLIVAHRGASRDAPENTLAAFRLAWEQKADAIEGDFHVTCDNQIVCIHDKTTARTAPNHQSLKVAESTLESLRKLDVGIWKDTKFSGETIPTLEEVLRTVPPGKQIFVEIKCGPEIVPLLKPQLESSGLRDDQIVIICFNESVISEVRRLMPQYKANWLTNYKRNEDKTKWLPSIDEVLASLHRSSAKGLGTNGNITVVDIPFIKQVVDSGFEFHVWTINDALVARRFASLGAQSITTDTPALIRNALESARAVSDPPQGPSLSIERSVMTKGYDGHQCWVHARPGVIPAGDGQSPPTVVLTTQRLDITGSDVFHALHSAYSHDLGQTWSELSAQPGFERQAIDAQTEETICDFTPKWHHATGKLLGIGHSVRYRDNRVMKIRPRYTGYAVYDPDTHQWSKPKKLAMPNVDRFVNCGAGSVQRYDLPDGNILLPVYFKSPEATQFSVTVCLCRFDGNELKYLRHGTELTVDIGRGLYEPSITRFGDRFYLTLRNDERGYVTSSSDGLHYEAPSAWRFDDGEELGNYNTQQHWVTHRGGLFLVYTRRGANNDHVFRHRAPLFIALVDPATLRVIRATERVLVPERGARLGNFGVADVTPHETWVVASEWMQTWRRPSHIIPVDNDYGADNSIHIARIKWSDPEGISKP